MKSGDRLSHPPIPFRIDHRREAARLRWLATSATTSALKAWLLEQAQQHERLVGTGANPAANEDAQPI